MIKFKCQNCNHQIGAPDKYASKRVRCPKCKAPIRVPQAPGKTGPQEPELIKFRCPTCNQKIGIAPEYAGKRVRCAKCKNPLTIPQASSRLRPPPPEDQTAVLRASQEQQPKTDDIWVDMDELRLAEANAPSLERQMEPNGLDYESADGQLPVDTGQRAYAERQTGTVRPKKKRSAVIIGAACVLVLLLVGIVVWIFSSDSGGAERQMEVDLYYVQEFAADYIGLLSEGKIEQAGGLLSSQVKDKVSTDEIEKFSEQIGRSEIIQLNCEQSHFEKCPEGQRVFLSYNLRYEDNEQYVIISIMAVDEKLTVESIAASNPLGDTLSIGQSSYEELFGIILAAQFQKYGPILAKFLGAFVIVVLVLGFIHIISMWIIFNKAGHPGWASIVPYYNMWVLAEIADKPGWLGLLFCFGGAIPYIGPIVVLVLWAVISFGVARSFNRGIGFGIGLTVVPFIFYPILAFASD
jgi:hypothetical protein